MDGSDRSLTIMFVGAVLYVVGIGAIPALFEVYKGQDITSPDFWDFTDAGWITIGFMGSGLLVMLVGALKLKSEL